MGDKKTFIQKLIEKKYNIDNIYVGLIGRQYETRPKTTEELFEDCLAESAGTLVYRWAYKPVDQPIGLFVKTIGGYKRISMGQKYKMASYNTMGQIVILKDKILPLSSTYADLYWKLKERKLNQITPNDARYIESQLNKDNVFQEKIIKSL